MFAEANSAEVKGELTIVLDVEDVKKEGKMPDTTEDTEQETVKDDSQRYQVSNNNVVAVTYGDRTAKTPYKTFLLNYNSYAVRVVYMGVVYTIEAGGYVMIPRSAN